MSDWTKLFKQIDWPVEPAEQLKFEFDERSLFAAAQALALLSYPTKADQSVGGPAHRFCEALIARMFRLAQRQGRIKALPAQVSKLKPSAMRSRIGRGQVRLANAFATLQTIFDAEMHASDKQAAEAGEKRTFTIRSSPDFGKMAISIPVRKSLAGVALIGAVPEGSSSSLRASIISHREAFGKGRGDPQEEYVNISNRYVRPMFPLLPLLTVAHGALMSKAAEAHQRKLGPLDILLLQPEWADELAGKVRGKQGQAICLLRYIGIPICACRMLEFTQRQKSNF